MCTLDAAISSLSLIFDANLNEVLGLEIKDTLGNAREEMKKGVVPGGMTKDIFMEMKLEEAMVEAPGYDLVVMGQPEGAGCYCAANTLLAGFMDRLAGNYPFIVMDNEAGMEHLSRMNMREIDYLLIVSDPSARGILTAKRVSDITVHLGLTVKNKFLIVNRAPDPVPEALQEKIDEAVSEADLPLGGVISSSNDLINQELSGTSYLKLDDNCSVINQATAIFDKIFS